MSLGEINKKIVRKTISENIVKKNLQKTELLKDKESYILETSEIEGARGLPRDTTSIYNELQQVLHGVGRRHANNSIKTNSATQVFPQINWACE